MLAQLSYDGYPAGLSERVFGRWNAEASGFLPLAKTLVLCGRLSASEILGEAPFWEYARLGGNDRLRGFADRRFVDRSMILANLEARWRALQWRLGREQFHLALVPFFDVGQVAPSLLSPQMWQGWHPATGVEAILTWNLSTHLNLTFGFSAEGFAFALIPGRFKIPRGPARGVGGWRRKARTSHPAAVGDGEVAAAGKKILPRNILSSDFIPAFFIFLGSPDLRTFAGMLSCRWHHGLGVARP
jgi:hypothetical protein